MPWWGWGLLTLALIEAVSLAALAGTLLATIGVVRRHELALEVLTDPASLSRYPASVYGEMRAILERR